jgi:hypothetical protein
LRLKDDCQTVCDMARATAVASPGDKSMCIAF